MSSRPTHCLVTPLLTPCIALWALRKLNALFTSVETCMMPNHRLERAVTLGWVRAANALRYFALASRRTRLRAASQLHR